jgi:hypothetical protein
MTLIHQVGQDGIMLGVPASMDFFQPGLRFGVLPGSGKSEAYLATGFMHASGDAFGSSVRNTVATANYQANFPSHSRTRAYFTIGGGLINLRLSSNRSETSALAGGGFGVRHWLAGDRGTIPFEARYDRIGRGSNNYISPYGELTLRFGFDVWMH